MLYDCTVAVANAHSDCFADARSDRFADTHTDCFADTHTDCFGNTYAGRVGYGNAALSSQCSEPAINCNQSAKNQKHAEHTGQGDVLFEHEAPQQQRARGGEQGYEQHVGRTG